MPYLSTNSPKPNFPPTGNRFGVKLFRDLALPTAIAITWMASGLSGWAQSAGNYFPPLLESYPSAAQPSASTPSSSFPSTESKQATSKVAPASASVPVANSAFKPNSSDRSRETALGQTFVSLENVPERIVRGNVPRSVKELVALEKQQSQVANLIQKVTVNIQQGAAQGSGVIITRDGYVLTAAHVAGHANKPATIILPDGRRVQGTTLGMNRSVDAGLIKINETNSKGWPHASLGTSSDLKLGQWCIAAGHPGGWASDRPAVIRVGRVLNILESTIFTDCALIGGDSGGPLFDLSGKLIGIHSRIGEDIDDNMHVPIDVYSDSWDGMASGKSWGVLPGYKPVIGVEGDLHSKNAVISHLVPNGPADRAGLQKGDLIRKFDNTEIRSFEALKRAVEATLPDDKITIEVERNGTVKNFTITIGQG